MKLRGHWNFVLASVATTAMALASLDSLPQYPDKVPWSPVVSWLAFAFACAMAMLLLWFLFIAWLTEWASNRKALMRIVLYPAIALLGSAAFLAPLLLSVLVLGVCRIALDCGDNTQGYFNVLSTIVRYLGVNWSLLTSIAVVATTATVAWRFGNVARSNVAV
jgi:hypothetical protein